MPGEGGLIACTWPRGGSDVLKKGSTRFAAYNNECQNGYEYAATSLMMWHGMPYHSLAHIWYMHHDRYHGSKRNPWCEIEWGIHYSRSMASYGHFTAVSGFEYHGPKGYMAFAPKITPDDFRAAFTSAEGWGSFEQKRTGKTQSARIELKHGKLKIKTLAFDVPVEWTANTLVVSVNGKQEIKNTFGQMKNRVTIQLNAPLELVAGQVLQINLRE